MALGRVADRWQGHHSQAIFLNFTLVLTTHCSSCMIPHVRTRGMSSSL